MRFNKGTSNSSSRPPTAATPEKKEKRKEKFMKKIMSRDEFTKSASFQKRLPTLKKKAMELETLSGVTVCVVAAGLDGKVTALWPEKPEKVKEAIESYRNANKKDRNEMTVLGYLDESAKKLEKKKLRALGKKLSNWIDGLEGDDEGLRNAVGFLGSKIEELEDRIRGWGLGLGLGGAEDRKGKKVMVTSSMTNVEEAKKDDGKGKRAVTSSSDSPSDGASRLFSSVDWFSGNNGGCSQITSIGQSSYQGVVDFSSPLSQPTPLAYLNNNGDGYGRFSLTEESIQEEVGNGVRVSQPTPLNWVRGNNGGGSSQFPYTGFDGKGFGVFGDELYQGIFVGDEYPMSLFTDTQDTLFYNYGDGAGQVGSNEALRRSSITDTQSSPCHGYGDEFGVVGSSDEAMRLSTENSLFGGYGGGEAFGLYETLPFPVWNPRQSAPNQFWQF